MRNYYLGGIAMAAIVAAGAALAQPAPAPAPAPVPQVQMHHMQRPATRNEVAAHVRDMFARLDTNKDGWVTKEEADAAHSRMADERRLRFEKRLAERGDMPKFDRGAAFDRMDTNKDGAISRDEFMSARPQIHERRMVMREGMHHAGMGLGHGRLFEMSDANKDGRVSLQEATAAALQHFDSVDLNHDGQITPEERRQAHQRLRGQRQPA